MVFLTFWINFQRSLEQNSSHKTSISSEFFAIISEVSGGKLFIDCKMPEMTESKHID